jgi:hypothetical protein
VLVLAYKPGALFTWGQPCVAYSVEGDFRPEPLKTSPTISNLKMCAEHLPYTVICILLKEHTHKKKRKKKAENNTMNMKKTS